MILPCLKDYRCRWVLILFFLLCANTIDAHPQLAAEQRASENLGELKDFDEFLNAHPAFLPDLKKDPSLIEDSGYLERHPELKQFLDTHPGLARAFGSKFKEQHCDKTTPVIFDESSSAVVCIHATSINPYQVADRVEHVVGSGFIIDSSGLILTNSHVAYGRQSLVVTLDDGTSVSARLVGADPIFDIAVLRISLPAKVHLSTARLGDSDRVRVGEDALAIGNALGLDQTLTRGTVSAINRILPPTFFAFQEPLIQIDTPINPGNSGGPLLNRCGEVIGITTAVVPDAQNIGFAIPINLAKEVIPSLLAEGRVIRPWLGFHGQFIDRALQEIVRVPLKVGLLIEVIEPGSPAEQANLQGGALEMNIAGHDFLIGGDIITSLNGTRLRSIDKVAEALRTIEVGTTLKMMVFREGKSFEVKYTLPERPLLPGDVSGQGAVSPLAGGDRGRAPLCCIRSRLQTTKPRK